MNPLPISQPTIPDALLKRLSDIKPNNTIVHYVQMDRHTCCGVVGGDNGAYEFFTADLDASVIELSDEAYGVPSTALRDAILKLEPLEGDERPVRTRMLVS